MSTKHTPGQSPEYGSAAYWRAQARNNRALAAAESRRRFGSIESIQIYDREAAEYDRRAADAERAALAKTTGAAS